MDDGTLYTMAEAARLKGVSYHTVSRAVRRGKLPARRLGRQALIAAADLAAWEPMYARAPKRYRRRAADPAAAPAPVGAAALDRAALVALIEGLPADDAALVVALCRRLGRRPRD